MIIRDEERRDHAAVHALNLAAFGSPAEARLVDTLRAQADPIVSLVAVQPGSGENDVVGHIMFSPVTLTPASSEQVLGLAPMAVSAPHQRTGVGSALVRTGLARCERMGAVAIVVLGHPEYYPRFGFTPASLRGLHCEFDAPDEAFMLKELRPGALGNAGGTVHYHRAFGEL